LIEEKNALARRGELGRGGQAGEPRADDDRIGGSVNRQ
jgi:hypothetical protein